MTFVVFFPLLSLCFSFSFWLSLASLSAIPAPRLLCWDLVPGEDLERNDGSSSRPYYMSAGLHKILRKGEEGAKLCTASWAMCGHFNCTVDSHSLLHIYCMCGGVWMFESKYCRAIYQNWMHPSLVKDGLDLTLILQFSQKRHRGLEKDLCLLPVLSQLRYLPFFLPHLCSFSSFSLYSLLTSALLRG